MSKGKYMHVQEILPEIQGMLREEKAAGKSRHFLDWASFETWQNARRREIFPLREAI